MKKSHKIYFLIASSLAILSWIIVLCCWDSLPNIIPIHFGISGSPDDWAEKSLFYVMLIPVLESFMTVMFYFLYNKPQYTNIPSAMWLMALEPKSRKVAFDLIQKMLVGTLLWINLLMTYIVYGMNMSAYDGSFALSPWIMLVLVGSMLGWLTYWTIKVYSVTKRLISSAKRSK